MNAVLLVGVGLLGGVGSALRFLLDGAVTQKVRRPFPYGTLAVNLSGSLVLGVLAGLALGHDAARLLAVGLIGGYTTFSTWMLETHRLADGGRHAGAVVHVVASLVLGVAAVWLGRRLGTVL